ncbi:MAG TPA: hypothetical protein VGS79_06540 [Puia sp.]|nr:hypothetical protein [Puia sp.]
MEQEKELTGEESLELIARMISKARRDYYDTGLSALLWGSVITICGLTTFANYYLQWPALDYIWFLTIAAVAPQVIIAIREGKQRKHRSHEEPLMYGLWISFGISMFLLSYVLAIAPSPNEAAIFLTAYGIPTFTCGIGRNFRPMLYGGLACWVFAILSMHCPYPYVMLYITAGGLVAWFIPGMILRKRYVKAKQQHV